MSFNLQGQTAFLAPKNRSLFAKITMEDCRTKTDAAISTHGNVWNSTILHVSDVCDECADTLLQERERTELCNRWPIDAIEWKLMYVGSAIPSSFQARPRYKTAEGS